MLTAQEQAEKAISLATRYDFPLFAGWAMSVRGWALAQQGQAEAGIAQLHAGIATYQATGAMCDQTHLYALLAEVYGIAGQIEKGLSAVTEGLRAVDKTGECFYEAELYRLKGELLLKQEHTEAEIEACYHQALAIARRQDARSLELRAAMSLYRLWQQYGKHDRAHRLLLEIYACFAEGLDTADLIEAKMLLEG